jgi:hypothetical protein
MFVEPNAMDCSFVRRPSASNDAYEKRSLCLVQIGTDSEGERYTQPISNLAFLASQISCVPIPTVTLDLKSLEIALSAVKGGPGSLQMLLLMTTSKDEELDSHPSVFEKSGEWSCGIDDDTHIRFPKLFGKNMCF